MLKKLFTIIVMLTLIASQVNALTYTFDYILVSVKTYDYAGSSITVTVTPLRDDWISGTLAFPDTLGTSTTIYLDGSVQDFTDSSITEIDDTDIYFLSATPDGVKALIPMIHYGSDIFISTYGYGRFYFEIVNRAIADHYTTFTVTVTDSEGNPLSGAYVRLYVNMSDELLKRALMSAIATNILVPKPANVYDDTTLADPLRDSGVELQAKADSSGVATFYLPRFYGLYYGINDYEYTLKTYNITIYAAYVDANGNVYKSDPLTIETQDIATRSMTLSINTAAPSNDYKIIRAYPKDCDGNPVNPANYNWSLLYVENDTSYFTNLTATITDTYVEWTVPSDYVNYEYYRVIGAVGTSYYFDEVVYAPYVENEFTIYQNPNYCPIKYLVQVKVYSMEYNNGEFVYTQTPVANATVILEEAHGRYTFSGTTGANGIANIYITQDAINYYYTLRVIHNEYDEFVKNNILITGDTQLTAYLKPKPFKEIEFVIMDKQGRPINDPLKRFKFEIIFSTNLNPTVGLPAGYNLIDTIEEGKNAVVEDNRIIYKVYDETIANGQYYIVKVYDLVTALSNPQLNRELEQYTISAPYEYTVVNLYLPVIYDEDILNRIINGTYSREPIEYDPNQVAKTSETTINGIFAIFPLLFAFMVSLVGFKYNAEAGTILLVLMLIVEAIVGVIPKGIAIGIIVVIAFIFAFLMTKIRGQVSVGGG